MSGERILVVEDEAVIAKDIKIGLKDMGYEVSAIIDTGEMAIKEVEKDKPDLVLMDIVLKKGGINGIEAATQIRSRFKTPVIFLTAYVDDDIINHIKKTEPFGYLVKPFDPKELRVVIEIALYKHQMEMEREKLICKLQDSLAKIHKLQGLIPICASCKKMRNDQGYWQLVEAYFQEHTEAEFTHTVCPECEKKIYSELYESEQKKDES